MNQDEIIEMARQAGFLVAKVELGDYVLIQPHGKTCIVELEAFAKLVATKEREACANTCEKWNTRFTEGQQAVFSQVAQDCAKAIRARSKS